MSKLSPHWPSKSAEAYCRGRYESSLNHLRSLTRGELPLPQDFFAGSQETLLQADLAEVTKKLFLDFCEVFDQCFVSLVHQHCLRVHVCAWVTAEREWLTVHGSQLRGNGSGTSEKRAPWGFVAPCTCNDCRPSLLCTAVPAQGGTPPMRLLPEQGSEVAYL